MHVGTELFARWDSKLESLPEKVHMSVFFAILLSFLGRDPTSPPSKDPSIKYGLVVKYCFAVNLNFSLSMSNE
jgi:hypothetical protein